MRNYFLLVLVIIVKIITAQDLHEKIQGSWVCNEIIDSAGNQTAGKYGESHEYLLVGIDKRTILFVEAPFDVGLGIDYALNKKDSIIDVLPYVKGLRPEKFLKIEHVADEHLFLSTKNESNSTIFYILVKQKPLPQNLYDTALIDCGTLLIKHLKINGSDKYLNRLAIPIIQTNSSLYYQTPFFDDPFSSNFGNYFANRFKLPAGFKQDEVSEELILQFTVSSKGAENFEILQGLHPEIDQRTLKIFEKSRKRWKYRKNDEEKPPVRLRIHLIFYLGESFTGF